MRRKFWEFRAAADDAASVGELLLYGPIGPDDGLSWLFDEVTPKQFREEMDGLGDVSELRVMINSGGGDVFAGQAIHSMLARHPAKVTVFVDGLAASIASIVAMAGDTVVMPRNAMMMVHNPWTVGVGDAREFRKIAETLDHIRESMLAAYQAKTGMDRPALLALLNKETWLTAEEAVDQGFADEIEETKAVAAALVRPGVVAFNGQEFDLGRFQHPPTFPERDPRDAAARGVTKRTAERALRDAGLSRDQAKALVARGWTEPERDAPPSVPSPDGLRLFLDFQKTLAAYRPEGASA